MTTTASIDEPRVARALPDGPMATPNAEVLRYILSEREQFLPRFLELLEVTKPIGADRLEPRSEHSEYRLSWVIHVLAYWRDARAFKPLLRHFASPLPYGQDDATWAVSRLNAAQTVPQLAAVVLRNAAAQRHAVDASLLTLARVAARLRFERENTDEGEPCGFEQQAVAAIELVLHREDIEPTDRLLDAASYLAALQAKSAWTRIVELHERGMLPFEESGRRDIYYLHEIYDGRRAHSLLGDEERNWWLSLADVPETTSETPATPAQ